MTDVEKVEPKTFALDRKLVAIAAALFVAGWFLGQQGQGAFPWQPQKDRPVLRFLAKVAKTGLWLLVVEPVPDDLPEYASVTDHNHINHREGW
jgi:hypothetical protein